MTWTDPTGKAHEVMVLETGKKMSLITYWDNSRRGTVYHRGRKYNHGTLMKLWVDTRELRSTTHPICKCGRTLTSALCPCGRDFS